MFKLVIGFCICIVGSLVHPVVADWEEAVDAKGLVRIPLQNPEGHSWYLDTRMGTPFQYELTCAVDNNHALSMVFSKMCQSCPNKGRGYDYYESSTYMHMPQNFSIATDDGFIVRGKMAADDFCYSMAGGRHQRGNKATTICFH